MGEKAPTGGLLTVFDQRHTVHSLMVSHSKVGSHQNFVRLSQSICSCLKYLKGIDEFRIFTSADLLFSDWGVFPPLDSLFSFLQEVWFWNLVMLLSRIMKTSSSTSQLNCPTPTTLLKCLPRYPWSTLPSLQVDWRTSFSVRQSECSLS